MRLLLVLSILLCCSAWAGDFTSNCDSRILRKQDCTNWLEGSLKTLQCQSGNMRCILHPWGSDFIKSWICTTSSSNCQPSHEEACPDGTFQTFVQGISACKKASTSPKSFSGICDHEMATHTIEVKSCDHLEEACKQFGGAVEQCQPISGNQQIFALSCRFPNIQNMIKGSSCKDLRSKCDLINSERGASGKLLSCLAAE